MESIYYKKFEIDEDNTEKQLHFELKCTVLHHQAENLSPCLRIQLLFINFINMPHKILFKLYKLLITISTYCSFLFQVIQY